MADDTPTGAQLLERLASALVRASDTAAWPDTSRLLDLDEAVIRTRLAPHVLHALNAPEPS